MGSVPGGEHETCRKGSSRRRAPVVQVLWYRLPEAPPPAEAPLCSLGAPPRSPHFELRERLGPHRCLNADAICVSFNTSQWAPPLQKACFCPFCSPTTRSPPTGCRRKSNSGTGTPCRMRWPESAASSNRSRWEWRAILHFRVRMDQHTMPCQVNVNKCLNSPYDGFTPA